MNSSIQRVGTSNFPVQRNCVILHGFEASLEQLLRLAFQRMGFDVKAFAANAIMLDYLQQSRASFVVLAGGPAVHVLKAIRSTDTSVPVVTVEGHRVEVDLGSGSRRRSQGDAADPITPQEIRLMVKQAVSSFAQENAIPTLNEMFFGTNPLMQQIQDLIPKVGGSDVPVLIQGETGSGKEVLARQLCASSRRAGKPFLKLNCAALPGELIESELFGYERGAFTGATHQKPGLFEIADNGTILLDEIGDMDVRLQAKLLQVLQDHEIRRLGGKEIIPVNIRLLAATHRNLEDGIRHNTFREDLYYRINVFTFTLPPLRQRREDIPAIAEFLLRRHADPNHDPVPLTGELRRALQEYNWPGNIRELENVLRRLTLLRDPNLTIQELSSKRARHSRDQHTSVQMPFQQSPARTPMALVDLKEVSDSAERAAILSALHATRWNRKKAARLLKVDYKALLYRMKKLSIDDKGTGAAPQVPLESEHALTNAAVVAGDVTHDVPPRATKLL